LVGGVDGGGELPEPGWGLGLVLVGGEPTVISNGWDIPPEPSFVPVADSMTSHWPAEWKV
jgi:hypothetical protein